MTYSSNDKTHLWGSTKIQNLEKTPFADWYSESKEEFTPQLPSSHYSNLSDVTVKIFSDTWCGDTQKKIQNL